MFSLNYQLMTQTLQRMHYTGMAQAIIPSGPFAEGTILLQVQGGIILASTIMMPDGKYVTDTQLIAERMRAIHVLEWDLTANLASLSPAGEPPTPPPPGYPTPTWPSTSMPGSGEHNAFPSPTPSLDAGALSQYSYPRRTPVDPTLMNNWPFIYRQVYNLSTGQYSEQDIGRLLHYPLTELIKVFDDLQRMKIIQRRS